MAEVKLTLDERIAVVVAMEKALYEMRQACLEDQGTPNGRPGTVGREQQDIYRSVIEKVHPR